MTIRRKLFIRYFLLVGLCMILLAGLAHHEFVVEPRVRAEMGIPKPSGSTWGEYAEMVFHGMIPVVLGCGWWLMRRTLKPIDDLTERLERVHAGNLGEPLPRSGNGDEIDRLTRVFNDMIQRLDRSFRHSLDFAMYASHELKTPLAIMRAEFESKERDPASPPSCHGCAELRLVEIDRLARMIDSLTLLSKADVGMVSIEMKPVRLAALVRECLNDIEVLGEPMGISATIEACDDVEIEGDRHRLRQLLLNLADNAVKYNKPNGSVSLSLRQISGAAEIAIANTGPGVPKEMHRRVFERFVRGPKTNGEAVEGCGLGLAICEWIVSAHNGTIVMDSKPGELTVVTVRLPIHAAKGVDAEIGSGASHSIGASIA